MQKIYVVMLYIALGLITLLVILTKGQPVLVRRKVFLGLLILSLTAPAAALVSCRSADPKAVVQKDVWQTEGWVDEDTYRVVAGGSPKNGLTNKIQRKGTARERAILYAQGIIIERFSSVRNEACAGIGGTDYNAAREIAAIVKSGYIVADRYDENDNVEIVYEVKSKGLKQKVLGMNY